MPEPGPPGRGAGAPGRRAGRIALALLVGALLAGGRAASAAAAGPEEVGFGPWQKVKESDGVQVHARSVSGTPIRQVRGVGLIEAPLLEVLAVIDDVLAYTAWMPKLKVSELLARPAPKELVGYGRFAAPWPVSDRDVVMAAKAEFSRADRSVTVTLRTTRWPGRDTSPAGVVRMRRYDGMFRLRALDPERTEITFLILGDPAGKVPIWVANYVAREVPHKAIKRLRKRVALMRGKYPAFVGRWQSELDGAGK